MYTDNTAVGYGLDAVQCLAVNTAWSAKAVLCLLPWSACPTSGQLFTFPSCSPPGHLLPRYAHVDSKCLESSPTSKWWAHYYIRGGRQSDLIAHIEK